MRESTKEANISKIDISNRYYVLSALVLIGVLTLFERFIFALVMEPIKQELLLSDSQLGLLTGIAFAGFYAVAGIPLARWADRGNRVTISALSVGLVGIMVSLSGAVSNFLQLLTVRAGLAVGEAGAVPAGLSLLSDYFDRAQRPRAIAIYTMSYSISMIVGYLCGGWLVDQFGWRYTLVLVGIPGLILAVIVKLTLKEPRLSKNHMVTARQPEFTTVLKVLWARRSLRHIFFSFCIVYFFFMGTGQWLATFFIRSHSMSTVQVGAWLAMSFGAFGILGNYLGGFLASRFAARQEKIQMQALAVLVLLVGVLNAGVYLAADKYVAIIFLSISAVVGGMNNGPMFAAVQSLVVDRMRSVTMALIFLFANLIGLGLGPLALGIISDLLNPIFGDDSLRYALVAFCPGVVFVAFFYWRASHTIEQDISEVEIASNSQNPTIDSE